MFLVTNYEFRGVSCAPPKHNACIWDYAIVKEGFVNWVSSKYLKLTSRSYLKHVCWCTHFATNQLYSHPSVSCVWGYMVWYLLPFFKCEGITWWSSGKKMEMLAFGWLKSSSISVTCFWLLDFNLTTEESSLSSNQRQKTSDIMVVFGSFQS